MTTVLEAIPIHAQTMAKRCSTENILKFFMGITTHTRLFLGILFMLFSNFAIKDNYPDIFKPKYYLPYQSIY